MPPSAKKGFLAICVTAVSSIFLISFLFKHYHKRGATTFSDEDDERGKDELVARDGSEINKDGSGFIGGGVNTYKRDTTELAVIPIPTSIAKEDMLTGKENSPSASTTKPQDPNLPPPSPKKEHQLQVPPPKKRYDPTKAKPNPNRHKIHLAAGCFWSVELAFQRIIGVYSTTVGYTQGKTLDPTYQDVKGGKSGHVETVEVEYDVTLTSLEILLDAFWGKHDATSLNKQGNDKGRQYRSGIYYFTEDQKTIIQTVFTI